MDYITLGKTGLSVSRVGLGGIPVQRITPEETTALLDAAIEAGINYIDTARGYTVSEQYLGRALRGRRDRFILATKSMARTAAAMAADIEISLDNLGTDYIDLYQIHNPSPEQLETVLAPGGAMEALLAAKAAGKIGHIGLTAHSTAVFARGLEAPDMETVMFPYNIVEYQGQDLIARCQELNVGFIAMKPLAGGAIENAALAMRYITSTAPHALVIPGMYRPEEVWANVKAADTAPLTAEELSQAEGIKATLGEHFCRRCGYCAPCTAGISIPAVFLFEGYLSRYGLENWARDRYATLSTKASACVGCGECETRCPYHLPIRQMLRDCAAKFGQ